MSKILMHLKNFNKNKKKKQIYYNLKSTSKYFRNFSLSYFIQLILLR